jgi:hypothetical protein
MSRPPRESTRLGAGGIATGAFVATVVVAGATVTVVVVPSPGSRPTTSVDVRIDATMVATTMTVLTAHGP